MCIRCLSLRLIHLILRRSIRRALYPLVQASQAGVLRALFRTRFALDGMALSSTKPLLSRYFFDCVGSTGGIKYFVNGTISPSESATVKVSRLWYILCSAVPGGFDEWKTTQNLENCER